MVSMPDAGRRESSIGLNKGRVELRSYEAAWSDLGEAERATVVTLLGDMAADVQHVGSTAVPGLAAKPILAKRFPADREACTNGKVRSSANCFGSRAARSAVESVDAPS
jgi:hypothetical protein